jgi:hypothetical protein
MSHLDKMNRLITFGKYKNQTYNYVIRNIPSYCEYVIKEKSKFKPFIDFQNYLINNYHLYKTCSSDKIVLDIETDKYFNILQIAYNAYDNNNSLLYSKDFYVYDGVHSTPFYPTISEKDIIEKGLSLKDTSDIVTTDINNTNIIIGHNIKNFDLFHINKLNDKFNNKIKDDLIIHDTMTESMDVVKALNKSGKIKYPNLGEMLEFLCNKKVENYHNAHGDIMATFECYKILCEKYNKFSHVQ